MRKLLRIAVIAIVTYVALALLVISPALNYFPHKYLQDTYGRELRTGWVLFNPFTLSLDIHDAELLDNSGARFLAFSEASVDLSMSSLWQSGWVLDRLYLRDLDLELVRMKPDEYNFSDLLARDTSAETPAAVPATGDAPLPAVTIHDVDLHAATIVVTDRARETPFTSRWNGLHIQMTDVSTVLEDPRPYSVTVEVDGGGKLQWQGELSIAQGSSRGSWTLTDLDLVNVWRFAQPWLAFTLKEGRLSVAGEYKITWQDALAYAIDNGRLTLANLDITPKLPDQLPDTSAGLKALAINGIVVDSASRNVGIDAVVLDNVAVATWREGNKVSLQDLFAVNFPASSPDSTDNGPPWTLALNNAQLRGGSLHWRSEYTDPQQLDIRPVEATLAHLTWPLSGESRLTLNLAANEKTKIAAHGTLALATGAGQIEYSLDDLPLTWFNPILPKPLHARITGGLVGLKGQATLQDFTPTTLALDARIREFSARQAEEEVTLTGFDLMQLDGLKVDMTQHTLALRKLTLDTYTGRLHIHKDGSINATNIWKREVGDEAQELAEKLTEDKPWTFSLPLVQISDSAIDFMDESLPIQFRTVIGDVEGEVRDLGSDPASAAAVDVKGTVDGYAPVTLQGEIAPMASPADLDLRLTFDGVDMALLSPYSGTYAGYKIERGLLDLDLHYSLQNNQLKGDNAVRIEKLKLGEKVQSDKAVDIPLQLALAILADANGVIDLAVPVKGDVNNPQFDLGSVITQAFINLLSKVVTAPFTLLASLVSSDEDLQRITFAAGSTQLNDTNKQKLTQLATALAQRPNLSMTITGRLNLVTDRERLQKNMLKAQLLADGLSADEIKARGPDWEEAIRDRYAELPASAPQAAAATARDQYASVVHNIAVPDEQLRELADQRAVAVKTYLINDAGLATDRAVVAQASLDAAENTFSGVELGMDN